MAWAAEHMMPRPLCRLTIERLAEREGWITREIIQF